MKKPKYSKIKHNNQGYKNTEVQNLMPISHGSLKMNHFTLTGSLKTDEYTHLLLLYAALQCLYVMLNCLVDEAVLGLSLHHS